MKKSSKNKLVDLLAGKITAADIRAEQKARIEASIRAKGYNPNEKVSPWNLIRQRVAEIDEMFDAYLNDKVGGDPHLHSQEEETYWAHLSEKLNETAPIIIELVKTKRAKDAIAKKFHDEKEKIKEAYREIEAEKPVHRGRHMTATQRRAQRDRAKKRAHIRPEDRRVVLAFFKKLTGGSANARYDQTSAWLNGKLKKAKDGTALPEPPAVDHLITRCVIMRLVKGR